MSSRDPLRTFVLLLGFCCVIPAFCKDKGKTEAKPVRDSVTKAFAAECTDISFNATTDKFYEEIDWPQYRKRYQLDDLDLACAPRSPDSTDPNQVYIFQIAHWKNVGDNYAIVSSDWFVYKSSKKGSPKLALTGLTASGDPLVYGKRRALLVSINVFDAGNGQNLELSYKSSAKQGKPENVQSLSTLATSLLGLTIPSAKVLGLDQGLPACTVMVAASCQEGTKRLPFDLNVVANAALKKKTSGQGDTDKKKEQGAHTMALPPTDGQATVAAQRGGEASDAQAGFKTAEISNLADQQSAASLVQSDLKAASFSEAQAPKAAKPADDSSDSAAAKKSDTSNAAQPGTVDCSDLANQKNCSFSRVFTSLDREWWDVSIGVTIPGVRQSNYSIVSGQVHETVTTNTNMYAFFDVFPAAYWFTKGSAIPHFAVGLPVTGQTFYRPFFGMAENLTSWTRLERLGFPLRLNFFAGVVYMKTQTVTDHPTTTSELTTDTKWIRVVKPLFGVEVPISSIADKLGKGNSPKNNNSGGSTNSKK